MRLIKTNSSKGNQRFKSYRLLKPILRRYVKQLVLAFLALLAAAGATLALPAIIRLLSDAGVAGNLVLMQHWFIALLVCALFLGASSALRFYMVSWLGERVVSDIRKQLFSHLLKLPSSFYDRTQIGEILSRLTTDTTLVERVVGTSVSMALRNSLLLLGSLAMLLITSLKLTLMVLVITPVAVVPVIVFARRYRLLSKESQTYVASSSAFASQVLSVMDVTKSYQYEDIASGHFEQVVEDGFDVSKRRIRARSWMTFFILSVMVSAMCAVMWLGAVEVITAGAMSPGDLAQFFLYAIFLATAVGTLSEVWGDLMRASGALQRIIDLLAEAVQQDTGASVTTEHDIVIDSVSFSYPSRAHLKTLQQVSFTVPVGSTTALVGKSGAGKSTIFKLLMRYYEPQEGSILIGGVNISELSLKHHREQIAFVGHDCGIFSTSIKDNLAMGREYTDEAIQSACLKASIADFIESLPDGYDTLLGERGVLLSEGQRQRIALARAILRDAPIIILDEATNALDAITESAITHALSEVFADKTVLVIAHRLSTVINSDQIIVMDQGSVDAVGNHKTLLKKSDIYNHLAKIQLLASSEDDL